MASPVTASLNQRFTGSAPTHPSSALATEFSGQKLARPCLLRSPTISFGSSTASFALAKSHLDFDLSGARNSGSAAHVGTGKAIFSVKEIGAFVERLGGTTNGARRRECLVRATKKKPGPLMPSIVTAAGPMDLSSLLLRNRIIFIGQPVNSQVAQRVISQLMTLAAVNEEEDIQIYINCPGGSTYSVLAIYDCMSWIKPKVSTVCFGIAASQGALLLAGGEKGKRFAMPNARIMIHQPQGGCGGTMDDVRRQVNEVMSSRDKIDKMYAAFTGQPFERVQKFTDRDRFLSAAEAMEFGLIDGLLETEY